MLSKMAVSELVMLLSICSIALCNDIQAGFQDREQLLVFDKTYDYKANIYVRSELVKVIVDDNSIISRIEVIDKRPEKDGYAAITAGGIGGKEVHIQLKGPGVFRDMAFDVRVYASDRRVKEFHQTLHQNLHAGVQRVGQFVNGISDRVNNGQVTRPSQNLRSESLGYGNNTRDNVFVRQSDLPGAGSYNYDYSAKVQTRSGGGVLTNS